MSWFPSDSKRFIAATKTSQELIVFNALTGSETQRIESHGNVSTIDIDINGRRLAAGFTDGTVRLWNTAFSNLKFERELHGHQGQVRTLGFAPTKKGLLVSIGEHDYSLVLWDVQAGKQLRRIQHVGPIAWFSFSADGGFICFGSSSGPIYQLNCGTGQVDSIPLMSQHFSGQVESVDTLALDTHSRKLVMGTKDLKQLYIHDLNTFRGASASSYSTIEIAGHTAPITNLDISKNSKMLVTSSVDKSIRVWDMMSGELLLLLTGHEDVVESVGFSADGQKILSSSRDGTVRVWAIESLYKTKPHLRPLL